MVIVKVVIKRDWKGEKFGECGFMESKGEEYFEKEVVVNSIKRF